MRVEKEGNRETVNNNHKPEEFRIVPMHEELIQFSTIYARPAPEKSYLFPKIFFFRKTNVILGIAEAL